MSLGRYLWSLLISLALATNAVNAVGQAKSPATSPPAASSQVKKAEPPVGAGIDPGSLANGVYRNKTLGFTCKIPEGWVLRTEEMSARDEDSTPGVKNGPSTAEKHSPQRAQGDTENSNSGRVLLAAFSRPPEAHGEEVNASIVIAAEPVATYPGLKEAAQYFGPLTEVAKAQGFTVDEEPYEIAIGTKVLVRGDFHRDVGTRVMRQSTLVMLARGYAVSFTVIAGTEDDVEELIDGLDFATNGK